MSKEKKGELVLSEVYVRAGSGLIEVDPTSTPEGQISNLVQGLLYQRQDDGVSAFIEFIEPEPKPTTGITLDGETKIVDPGKKLGW